MLKNNLNHLEQNAGKQSLFEYTLEGQHCCDQQGMESEC